MSKIEIWINRMANGQYTVHGQVVTGDIVVHVNTRDLSSLNAAVMEAREISVELAGKFLSF